MHFGTKSYLKSTRNHTAKHALAAASLVYEIAMAVDVILGFR